MSNYLPWEENRLWHTNNVRAMALQKILEEAGYFQLVWSIPPSDPSNKLVSLEQALVNLLADFLHLAEKQGHVLDRSQFQELVDAAYALHEKNPRLPR